MEVTIPAIPAGILTLLAFLGPYAVAALNGALSWVEKPWQKKAVAVTVALSLAGIVLLLYITMTGDVPTSWPAWFILAVLVLSASFSLVTKRSADAVEERVAGA